ncbi:MAG: T9SS type A sorting domain-containing protein [Saprospiraceae bacterium]|nr:T9SS type A sorting domain-containing protein [Saprospiraceae bacterium]
MRIILTISLCCLCISFANAQTTKYFKKTFGDPYPFYEAGQNVYTLSNGYLIGAYALNASTFEGDAYLLQTDFAGNSVLNIRYQDSTTNAYVISSVNNNDYYFLAGELYSVLNSGLLLKIDSSGVLLWQKSIGDGISNNGIYNIISCSDGNLVMSGWIQDTITQNWQGNLIKTDTSGNIIWNRTYQGTYNSAITSVIELANGNFALIGRTDYVLGSGKVWLLVVDPTGVLISTNSYFVGGSTPTNDFQVANSFDLSLDSGYIIGGHAGVDPNLIRGLIIKLNASGQVDWYKMLTANSDGTGNIWKSRVTRIRQLADSSFVCVAYLQTGGFQPFKMLLIKFDFYGNELWRRSFNSVSGQDSYGYDFDLTADGGFILTGRAENGTDAQLYLVKTNCLGFTQPPVSDFSVVWNGSTATFYNLSGRADTCIYYFGDGDSAFVLLTDTTPVVHSYTGSGPYTPYLLAYACGEVDTLYQTIYTGINNEYELIEKSFTIFPNPAAEKITLTCIISSHLTEVKLLITDLTGRVISSNQIQGNPRELEIDISYLNNGSYLVSLEHNGNILASRKLMVVR